jgi:hypothetical protein
MSLAPDPADGGAGTGTGDDWFLDCGILDDLPAAACGAFPWDASPSSSNPRSAQMTDRSLRPPLHSPLRVPGHAGAFV